MAGAAASSVLPFFFVFSLFGWLGFQSVLRHASDDVRNVKDELHVHGGLRDAGAASVDDGDQGAVQLVHVALGEELASAAGLVLHLRARQNTFGTLNLLTTYSG